MADPTNDGRDNNRPPDPPPEDPQPETPRDDPRSSDQLSGDDEATRDNEGRDNNRPPDPPPEDPQPETPRDDPRTEEQSADHYSNQQPEPSGSFDAVRNDGRREDVPTDTQRAAVNDALDNIDNRPGPTEAGDHQTRRDDPTALDAVDEPTPDTTDAQLPPDGPNPFSDQPPKPTGTFDAIRDDAPTGDVPTDTRRAAINDALDAINKPTDPPDDPTPEPPDNPPDGPNPFSDQPPKPTGTFDAIRDDAPTGDVPTDTQRAAINDALDAIDKPTDPPDDPTPEVAPEIGEVEKPDTAAVHTARFMEDSVESIPFSLDDPDSVAADALALTDARERLESAQEKRNFSEAVPESLAWGVINTRYADSQRITSYQLDASSKGAFDAAFSVETDSGPIVVVMELKGGPNQHRLGSRQIGADRYQQGTREYLHDVSAAYRARDAGDRSEPADNYFAQDLARALEEDRVHYLLVEEGQISVDMIEARVRRFNIDS